MLFFQNLGPLDVHHANRQQDGDHHNSLHRGGSPSGHGEFHTYALNINNTTRHANVNKADLFSALYSLASTICEWTIGAEWKAANLEL